MHMKTQEKNSKTVRIRLLPQLYIMKHCVYIFVLHNLYLERYLQVVTEYSIIFLNWSNILFRNIIYIFYCIPMVLLCCCIYLAEFYSTVFWLMVILRIPHTRDIIFSNVYKIINNNKVSPD